jgi:hypothetical protein
VTILEKDNYGTDAQVVAFGCMRSVADGTLLMVICVTFASRCPSSLKLHILIKFNIGFFLLLRLRYSLYNSVLYGSFVTYAVFFYRSGNGNVKLDIVPVRFCSEVTEFLNLFTQNQCLYLPG